MKKWLGVVVIMLMVAAWSLPASAGKVALTENDLDLITAMGEPTVLIAEATLGAATATLTDDAVFNLALTTDAQKGLRALTVANVVGEVQLLVNLNVLAAQGDVAGTDQRNFGVQSWGSTLPLISATVPGVPGITVNPACTTTCTGKANGNIGVVAAPGDVQIGSASGDVIAKASGGTSGEVTIDQQPVFNLALAPNAQTDLASLFITNVVGRAQAIYNINVAAATLNLIPDPGTPFATPFANATGVIKQVNSGVQFRGTPLGVGNTAAIVNVTHTPN